MSWLSIYNQGDERLIKRINEGLIKSGAFLEDDAESVLENKGFKIRARYYSDFDNGEEKTREIDIHAETLIKEVEIKNEDIRIPFSLKIIGECKFNDNPTKTIFVFPLKEQEKANMIVRLPLYTNMALPSSLVYGSKQLLEDFMKNFDIELFSHRVHEKDTDNINKPLKEEDTIFNACNSQLLPAIKFFYNRDKKRNIEHYKHIEERERFEQRLKSNEDVASKVLINLRKEFLPATLFVPILITNREIATVRRDKDKKILIDKTGYFIWLINPNPSKFDDVLEGHWEQPIIVCNIEFLDDCLSKIQKGCQLLVNEAEKAIKQNPMILVQEIIEQLKKK